MRVNGRDVFCLKRNSTSIFDYVSIFIERLRLEERGKAKAGRAEL